jgi:hypothetical protein
MTLKTYYAKLECSSSVANGLNTAREYYKNFCDFMSYLTGSDVASLVNWHSGSGAASGSFGARTHWDGALPFGTGSFSIWKFHTNSNRNWEWYLYAQDQFQINLNDSFYNHCQPILVYGQTLYVNGGDQALLIQAAVCFSGSTSFYPWGGTTTDGFSQAASPRWISGSNDRTLYVLPRSNDFGGTHATNKQNAGILGRIGFYNTSPRSMRYHFIYDGDALFVANDTDMNRTYTTSYVGAFELRSELSGSGIGGSSFGFMMCADVANAASFQGLVPNQPFGTATGTNTYAEGGLVVPVGIFVSGSKIGIGNSVTNFLQGAGFQPSTLLGSTYTEFPIFLGIAETPYFGLVGQVNSGLVKYTYNTNSEDINSDNSRAIIGFETTAANTKLSIPWTGSVAIGSGSTREGLDYTWTQDYG